MKEFVLIFRESKGRDVSASPEQMQQVMNNWMAWMSGIAEQNKLVDKGNRRLSIKNGKTIKPNNIIIDGPYTEVKEFINGFITVKTDTMDEAVEIAKECPILSMGGNVEVRTVVAMDDNN